MRAARGALGGCLLAMAMGAVSRLGPVAPADLDEDGLPDADEQRWAEAYAPVVFHPKTEEFLPASVAWFLGKTELWFYTEDADEAKAKGYSPLADGFAGPVATAVAPVAPAFWSAFEVTGAGRAAIATTLYDRSRRRGFYLRTIEEPARRGNPDTGDWATYYHCYPNERGGVTVQYWAFYPFNKGPLSIGLGDHGGDWECVQLVLDGKPGPGERPLPVEVRLLGHRDIDVRARGAQDPRPWDQLKWESGTHVRVFAEKGAHERHAQGVPLGTRQECWTGGKVTKTGLPPTPAGPLLNLGEKTRPMPGMEFVLYSGLWGSPAKRLPVDLLSKLGLDVGDGVIGSGYWGPAYNETGKAGPFFAAWGAGMAEPLRSRTVAQGDARVPECGEPEAKPPP